MAKFEIVTEDLLSAADNIKSIEGIVSDYGTIVGNYDCDTEGEDFPFRFVRDKIAGALVKISLRMMGGADVLRMVVEEHDEIQKLKFNNDSDYKSGKSTDSSPPKKIDDADNNSDDNESDTSSDFETTGYSGATSDFKTTSDSGTNVVVATLTGAMGPIGEGLASYAEYGLQQVKDIAASEAADENSSTDGSSKGRTGSKKTHKKSSSDKKASSEKNASSVKQTKTTEKEYTGEENELNKINVEEKKEPGDVTETFKPYEINDFNEVSYAYVKEDILTDESKILINNSEYDTTGYLRMNDRYVIACDEDLAKVGDVITFTNSEGVTTECVVGINTFSDEYSSSVHFLVDKNNWRNVSTSTDNILSGSVRIENIGNFATLNNSETDINNNSSSEVE